MKYSFYKRKKRRDFKKHLEKQLVALQQNLFTNPSEISFQQFEGVKEEIERIEHIETQGAILRARTRWAEDGEKILSTS